MIDMEKTASDLKEAQKNIKKRIIVCAGTGCVAGGSLKVYDAFVKEAKNMGLEVSVEQKAETKGNLFTKSGCQGFCQMGPLVTILPEDILYTKVTVDDVKEILEKSVKSNELVERLCYKDGEKICKGHNEIPFYTKQHRYVIKECGVVDPESIEEYIYHGGYFAARKALEMTDTQICEMIMASGLRGRGGGGFLTGKKWDLTRQSVNSKKYIICNGDEGDPGAFMDRSLMEGNPHAVIEGMIIASKAVGADEGYVYVRTEYQFAVERMKIAVKAAEKAGILGKNIFGSNHNFKLHVMEGAGAFVCGEETALMASIEGKRGMPTPKPPYPAVSGLFGKPTVINNVETLVTAALIMRDGVDNFKSMGTPKSTGTKTFAVTGHVLNTGLIEVPFGSTLSEIVIGVAGGVTGADGKVSSEAFKAVQIGGPSGGTLTKEHLNLPLDYESLKQAGAMVGSGGLVVTNTSTCMVKFAKFFMQFTQNESCGKCVPCREGTRQMLLMLEDITSGKGTAQTLIDLEELARAVTKGSLCGLGKTAPNPVLSTLKYFKDEYIAHINGTCPAGECTDLMKYYINDKCIGCTACALKCPVKCISGEKKKRHVIDTAACIKCGVCMQTCKFGAVERV
jgi:NADH-quinone oxidoreductase subunit F